MNELVLKQTTLDHLCALRREAGRERQLRRFRPAPGHVAGLLARLRAAVRPASPCVTC